MEQVSNFQVWHKKHINLKAGQLYTYNLNTQSNIVQVFNKVASGGSTVFLDETDKVSPTYFSVEIQQGKNASLVKPYELGTVYLYAQANVSIEVIEIQSEDLSFMFTASQVVDVQGSVQVQEPVTIDGTVQVSGETEITNDSGSAIPVSLPAETPFTYQAVTAGASGDQTVKSGSGEVAQIISDGTANVYLKDGTNQVYPASTAETVFSSPVTCGTNITLNFDQAGTAYIIYR